jgi:predicted HicB family RNase H-like nuclease
MTDHFTYRVSWSEEDGEHVGTCLEFPSLSHLADDPEAALRGIRKLVADVAADLRANNEPIPQPLADSRYSGKFMTRIPPELHRQLAFEAAQEQISLNRLVSLRLSVQPFGGEHAQSGKAAAGSKRTSGRKGDPAKA